jgi:hypothetical protein
MFHRYLACLAFLSSAWAYDAIDAPATADEIFKRVQEADRQRQATFAGYTGLRQYVVENTRFHLRATMKVRIQVQPNGSKQFQILEVNGPPSVRKMVFERMLNTESSASTGASLRATKISRENYSFRFLDMAVLKGRKHFVLEAEPKDLSSELLFRGKVWIDAEEFAIVRIEGAPAKSPSFWVKKTQFVHQYQRVGNHWLALSNESTNDIRIFGKSTTRIDYTDYKLTEKPGD